MKSKLIIYGDNTESYSTYAKKAAINYTRSTGRSVYAVGIKDANGYVSFSVRDHGGNEIALYGLENDRVVCGYKMN